MATTKTKKRAQAGKEPESNKKSWGEIPVLKKILGIAEAAPEEEAAKLPSDLAERHDYYLYESKA